MATPDADARPFDRHGAPGPAPAQRGSDRRPGALDAAQFGYDDEHPARAALDALFRSDPYAAHLGIEVVDWGLGWSEVAATPSAAQGNFLGSIHGGFMFSLADIALSFAGNSWGRMSLAVSMEIQWVRAGAVGVPMRALACCRSRSRRIASFGIEVLDADDRLLASLQGLNYRADTWHLNEETWPADWRARF